MSDDLQLKDQTNLGSDIKIPHPPAEKVGGRRVKNPRHRNQGGQDLPDESGDNPQDVPTPEQSTSTSMDVDKPAKGGSMQVLTGGQMVEQKIPSIQDLKHNPKAIPSTYFPPVYENTKNRRNLGGDYTQLPNKFNYKSMDK